MYAVAFCLCARAMFYSREASARARAKGYLNNAAFAANRVASFWSLQGISRGLQSRPQNLSLGYNKILVGT